MILTNAAGNALYAGEFVRLLLDRDALIREGAVWRLVEREPVAIPRSIQALISARLDTLPTTQREVLSDAAVVGGTFWVGAVATLGARSSEQIERALEKLASKHYIKFERPSTLGGEREVSFTHMLVRDAAYAELTRRDRAVKHEAVAKWIEQTFGERLTDLVDILAYHTYTAVELRPRRETVSAELHGAALRYSSLAAERNLALDSGAAAYHLERALSLSDELDPSHTKLVALGGEIALQEGRPKAAVALLEQAVTEFGERGDTRGTARAMLALAYAYEHLGDPRGFELPEKAVALLDDGPPCVELLDAVSLSVATKAIAGAPRAGIERADRAFALAAELGIDRPTRALSARGLARAHLGDLAGIDDLRDAIRLGTERGEGRVVGNAYVNLMLLEHVAHGPAAMVNVYKEGLDFSSRRSLQETATRLRMAALEALLDLGQFEQLFDLAEELVRQVGEIRSDYVLLYTRSTLLRAWTHVGEKTRIERSLSRVDGASRRSVALEDFVVEVSACAIATSALGHRDATRALVRGLARAGDVAYARRVIDAMAHPSPYADAAAASATGVLAEAEGEFAEAAAAYEAAGEGFAGLGVPLEQWVALLGLARTLGRTGRVEAAAQVVSAAELLRASMPSGRLLPTSLTRPVASIDAG